MSKYWLQVMFLWLMFLPSLTKFLAGEVMVMVSTRPQTKANLPPAVTFCLYNQSKYEQSRSTDILVV